jgi:hypothetical protein
MSWKFLYQGRDSENFISKLLNIVITLGLKILIFSRKIVLLLRQLSLKTDVSYYGNNKTHILCIIGSQMHLKVTKI